MSLRIFVSATNTNIGKTYVMTELIKSLSAMGHKIGVIKPIETGVENYPLDAKQIFDTAKSYNTALEALTLDDVCPYQYPLPAAPFVAKGEETIEMNRIQEAIEKIESFCDILLIEGAGGLLVPVQDDLMVVDLAKTFADKLLLVVPSRLGSINDTLLNLNYLEGQELVFEWTINLFEDIESFDEVTKPYYDAKYTDYMIFQQDKERLLKKLIG